MDDQNNQKKIVSSSSSFPSSSSLGKEKEAGSMLEKPAETITVPEVSPEVERVGVKKISQTIEIPPDVKKLGVSSSGLAVPPPAVSLPSVVLPISDQKVLKGLHASVLSAFRWLAVWCLRKLQKAHLTLKVIHGKIVRVKVRK